MHKSMELRVVVRGDVADMWIKSITIYAYSSRYRRSTDISRGRWLFGTRRKPVTCINVRNMRSDFG